MTTVPDVLLHEYTDGDVETRLVCTDDVLRHVDERTAAVETIPLDEVVVLRRDTDESLADFDRLAAVFAWFAVLFTLLSVPFLLAGIYLDPIATGVYGGALLSWVGTADFYRQDQGTVDVLELYTVEERYLLFAEAADSRLDEVAAHVAETVPDVEQCDAVPPAVRARRITYSS